MEVSESTRARSIPVHGENQIAAALSAAHAALCQNIPFSIRLPT
jgi:hypothetical protein